MQILPLLLLVLCWLQLFNRLRLVWAGDEQYGYGWFVPLLAAILLWRRWREQPRNPGASPAGHEPQPPDQASTARPAGLLSRLGLGNLVFGPRVPVFALILLGVTLVLLLPVRLVEEGNPDYFKLLWLHALALVALSLGALRWCGGRPALRSYWFPVCFLLTSVPWPSMVESWVTQGLMHDVAQATVEVVGWLGIPAVPSGSVVDVAGGSVGIDEACSGIRSLHSAIMLAFLLGDLLLLSPWKRVALLPFGVLVALAANLGRTCLLTWSAAKQGFDKMHAWHGPAGLAVVAVVMLSLSLLAWLWRKKPADPGAAPADGPEPAPGSLGPASRDRESAVSGQPSLPLARPLLAGFFILCCLWLPLAEGLTWAWYHWPGKGPIAAAPWSIRWPTNEMAFADTPLHERTLEILRPASHKHVSWNDPRGHHWDCTYLYWPPGQNLDIYVGGHDPEVCMSGAFPFIKRLQPVTVTVGPVSIRFFHSLFRNGWRTVHVFRGTWEPFVPPSGQRLFGDRGLRTRLKETLERRLIQGGITLEISLSGSAAEQEATHIFQQQLAQLIVPEPQAKP